MATTHAGPESDRLSALARFPTWARALAGAALALALLAGVSAALGGSRAIRVSVATSSTSAEPPTTTSVADETAATTATTTAPTTAVDAPAPGGPGLLDQLAIAPEGPRAGYSRDHFAHWIDADGDGCDTRREVLIEEALDLVTVGPGCSLTGGRWHSPYDGVTATDPSSLDIDHLVPLAEAWESGASSWPAEQRRDFANDLEFEGSLIAVTASSNRSKSDKDPAAWKPTASGYWCEYATTWVSVKSRWELSADEAEASALAAMLATC